MKALGGRVYRLNGFARATSVAFVVLSLGLLTSGVPAQNSKRSSGDPSSAQRPALATEGTSRCFAGDRFTPVSVSADGSGNIYVLAYQAAYHQMGGDTGQSHRLQADSAI